MTSPLIIFAELFSEIFDCIFFSIILVSINFSETDYDLSIFSTKTVTHPKVQELDSFIQCTNVDVQITLQTQCF